MMPSITPILTGRATSKPRTCLSEVIFTIACLFSLLHQLAKYAFDYLRISSVPSAKIVHCERILNGCEFLVFLVQSFICGGAKMVFDESALRFLAPEILHETLDHRPVCGRDVAIDNHRWVLAEYRRFRNDDLNRRTRLLHQKPIEFISDERITVAAFECRACLTR